MLSQHALEKMYPGSPSSPSHHHHYSSAETVETPNEYDETMNTSSGSLLNTSHVDATQFGALGVDLQDTSSLSTDLEQLYQLEHFRDVFFLVGSPSTSPPVSGEIIEEPEIVSAHKCVLAARCPYFHNMFTLGFRESGISSKEDPIKKPNLKPSGTFPST